MNNMMISETIEELRELKKKMSICFESEIESREKDISTINKAIIACEQLRKARKKTKRWKRKFYALMRIHDDTATDRSKECNYCKHLNDPLEKICKECYHYYTDKFKPNTKGEP